MPDHSPLAQVLQEAAAGGTAPSDVGLLHERLRRRHRRRSLARSSLLAGATAVAVTAGVLVVQQAPRSSTPPAAPVAARWEALPPAPLSPRQGPLAVAVGEEVLVVGGTTDGICPDAAGCVGPAPDQVRADGAAFSLPSRTWRRVADAPIPLRGGAAAVIGDQVFVLAAEPGQQPVHLGYDVSDDRWRSLAPPPGAVGHRPSAVLATDRALVAWHPSESRPAEVYDPAVGRWTTLPRDPLGPGYDRQMAWTGAEVVLLQASPASPSPQSEPVVRAAALDLDARTWRRLPDRPGRVAGATDWSWDGRRVVSPYYWDAGDELRAGGGALDPTSGQWGGVAAPDRIDHAGRARFTVVAGSMRFKPLGAQLYDARDDRWLDVPEPPAGVRRHSGQAWVADNLFVWGGGGDRGQGGDPVATGGVLVLT